ncbi:type II secretion system protein [Acidovorax sp. A1169]|uniref:type II secretion system protein n=1 Tax=Acidovorax sp. A1169 TaxID=3059524 RepID=UPI002737C0BB|nr:prepilin-type N-terminal cleavage/methylation domain-containing protein [Acidovorax sp. A1169]MDP4077908.1 prepilin-type N-terminal cleavage/methylation domain-containing protein [Acidovorax sp. A1169]
MKQMQSFRKLGRKVQQGFTLVELAIVLAVIGLIIGAVAIAKDVQRNAEYQKAINKYAFQWKMAYDQYYQRTGVVLGDCQQAPIFAVNGTETTINNGSACTRAGSMAVAGIPGNFGNGGLKICSGQGYTANTVGSGDKGLAKQNLRELMTRAGVRMPPGRGEGHEDRFLYVDSNGNGAELQVCFQWNPPGTASGAGNVMVIRGLTPDLARYMDQVIDGKPDSREGRFRIQGRPVHDNTADANAPGTQWEANNTQGVKLVTTDPSGSVMAGNVDAPSAVVNTSGNAGGTVTGRTLDEDQVILLTAHWIMEQ